MPGFLVPLMLFGLAGVAIPPIIHLLNRRRFEVIDWGAMQFLQISETTRRRLLIEELLLMLLRMGLIGVLVLGLAGPFAALPGMASLGVRPNRDVVLIFDGSYSMGYTGTGTSAQDAAKEWATGFVNELSAGDSVAILQAKQQVVPVLGEPSVDLEQVRDAVRKLPPPRGGCDWPQAVQAAFKILEKSQRLERDIIILSDGQKFGWADDQSLLRWELLANQQHDRAAIKPRIFVVNVAPQRPADPPNWSLAPVRASRAIASAGQLITFKTGLVIHGQTEYQPPFRLRLEIDGKPAGDIKAPSSAKLEKGQIPLTFTHRFETAGSHLVSVVVEPDPPREQRPAGYTIKDHLPGDNRQDFALEVVKALPVLLVDGDTRPKPKFRGTDFLRDALAPARDPAPRVLARVLPIQEFQSFHLTNNIGKDHGTKPRVLVLSNVPQLTAEQQDAVARFLGDGGGVLVTLGERVDAKAYNEQLFRGGQGWLPVKLEEIKGDESAPEKAVSPLPSSFFHPALELFRELKTGGLADARFPRWYAVGAPGRNSPSVPVALLTSNDPFLVERPFRAGRVLLCTVPLDNSWRTNLPDLPAFAPLAHELIYYLAGARSAEYNLQPGQPLLYRPAEETPPGSVTLQPPDGEPKVLTAKSWPLVYEGMRETGVYRLEAGTDQPVYYVVQPDHHESDLTAGDEADRAKVSKLVPMTYEDDRSKMFAALTTTDQKQEIWWWFLLGVVGLLCGEVWLTRRIVKNR